MSVIIFLTCIGLQALIFSRIEGWQFSDGIYFSLVTSLTIGFGDFEPTHTATRILDFPFAVLAISLLAVMLGQLVGFISARAAKRRNEYRELYEAEFEERRSSEKDDAKRMSLVMELAELQKLEKRHERFNQLVDMAFSTIALIIFWLIGAAVYYRLEGFAFGTSLYFCYVFFLTIGYGVYAQD